MPRRAPVMTADTMTTTQIVTTHDTTHWRQRTVTTTVTTYDAKVTHKTTHAGYSRLGFDEG